MDSDQICWIETIEPADASPELADMYRQVGAVHDKIHNLYRAFSLQPGPLIAADQHYRDVLHNEDNQSEPWFLELLASQAAIIAECHYALANHGANFIHLLGDQEQGERMLDAIRSDDYDDASLFSRKHAALLRYDRTAESITIQEIRRLNRAIVEMMHNAIKQRGTSLEDDPFVDVFGNPGGFTEYLEVYGRAGERSRNGRGEVQKLRTGGQTHYYCDYQV